MTCGLRTQISLDCKEAKKHFYSSHVFHERHMNLCPIGCAGCAVSSSQTNVGTINFQDIIAFYKDARDLGVSLKLTKVEGYDPVFVHYPDDLNASFADTVKAAVDMGHQIVTPICTTGGWKSPRTFWQLEELGKLPNKYRRYEYLSGKSGESIALSVPREIRPFEGGRYDYDFHIDKVSNDIERLTYNGDIDVLIYYNSNIEGDIKFAEQIRNEVAYNLKPVAKSRANLMVTNFNNDTMPESCFRFPNSVLVSDRGFDHIDEITLEWGFEIEAKVEKNKKLFSDKLERGSKKTSQVA
jgi:hypothetical protein